LGPRKLS
jgi:hypothetical protein